MGKQRKSYTKVFSFTENELSKCTELVKRLGISKSFSTTLINVALKLYEYPELDVFFRGEDVIEQTLFQYEPEVVRCKEALKEIVGSAIDDKASEIFYLASLSKANKQ